MKRNNIKLTNEEFINECNSIHNNKYDYSKLEYTGAHNYITVICPEHGEFKTLANNHKRGHGCLKCGTEITTNLRRFTKEDAIFRAKLVWGDVFDYSEMEYTKMFDKHKIKCNICGEYFEQILIQHINGKSNGCPNCKTGNGYSRSQLINFCEKQKRSEPQVYVVRLFNEIENFIKIGITSIGFNKRKYKIPYEYEILKEIKGSPLFVYDKEIELHRKFKKYKYIPKISFGGQTECFSIDILPLIKEL